MILPAIEDKIRREKEKIRKEIRLPLPDYCEERKKWEREQEELEKAKEETVVYVQII
jgi:hypothetical protein